MKQRVVIAIALACNPKLLLADEPTTALDVTIQAQVMSMINELKEEFGPAFRPGPEQDYMQEQLDGALREIFGEATVPFAVRHPYIREIDYTKRR